MTDDQIEKLADIEVADNSGDEEEGDDGAVDSAAAADAPKKKKSKICINLPLTSLFNTFTFIVSYTISHTFHIPHCRKEEEKEEEEICS